MINDYLETVSKAAVMIVIPEYRALICHKGLTKPQKVLVKEPNSVTEI